MKRAYHKQAITYAEQVARLKGRGMIIDDLARAEFYLQHLNYYRFGAYWLPFESNHDSHSFRSGTRFTDVLNLYVFDRELRLLVLDAIERVEVSMRSQWAYQLGHHHGPHAHLDPSLARQRDRWQQNLDSLREETNRSDEVFIRHFRENYNESLPPAWVVCEVMSLGQLSRWFANLKPKATRRAIADVYHVDERVLQSWLHHLTHVRNYCAHHSRLWNREFTITPKIPHDKPAGLAAQFHGDSRKMYNSLVMLLHCMDIIAPKHRWRTRLKDLLSQHSTNVTAMGFPSDWDEMPIWRGGGE